MDKDFLSGKKQFLGDNDFDDGQSFDFSLQRSKEHDESQRFDGNNQNITKLKNQEN